MKLPILDSPTASPPSSSRDRATELTWSQSLLERSVLTLPEDARILVAPGGRNAQLAVADLLKKNLLGNRTFVGFADDAPDPSLAECRKFEEAVSHGKPTHVLLCSRRPELEDKIHGRIQKQFPHLDIRSARSEIVRQFSENITPSRTRQLEDIDSVVIVMCKTCNLRCNFCYQSEFESRMDPAIFTQQLASVYPHARILSLVGGEVTFYRHALPFAQTIPDQYPHLQMELTTNGVGFNHDWAEVFCKTGGRIGFSVIAGTGNTYEAIAGKDCLSQVADNIRRVVALRDKVKSNLALTISAVITPQNQHELIDMVQLGYDLGVDSVGFGADSISDHQLDRKIIEKQIQQIRSENKIKVYVDRIGMVFPDLVPQLDNTTPCTSAADSIFVEVNGDVFVCCQSHMRIGSLQDQDIESIWCSDEGYAVEADVTSGQCATCPQDCVFRPPTVRPQATNCSI